MKKYQQKQFKTLLPLFMSALFLILFSSCTITIDILDGFITGELSSGGGSDSGNYDDSDLPVGGCPSQLAASAFEYAKKYAAADTEYKYGAQDPLRAIQIDCSGLVIRCYGYALKNTGYSLIQSDMSSSYMYEHASIKTTTPRRGDLIFIGEENSSQITHIAIFDRFEGDQVYFIDATNQGRVNGVSERHYARTNRKIKAYGIMKVKSW